eukprot:4079557-Amphidinium_carterae.1
MVQRSHPTESGSRETLFIWSTDPKSFEQHCLKYGFLLASDILFHLLHELVPSNDRGDSIIAQDAHYAYSIG